jgi:hypothetical protein
VAHFFYVFYVGLDGGEEGFEFGAGAKAFEMAFFGVPFDAQDVLVWSFGAVGQLVGQAMGGGGERFYRLFVGLLEGAASWFVDLVPRVFHDHDGSWVRYLGLARDYFSEREGFREKHAARTMAKAVSSRWLYSAAPEGAAPLTKSQGLPARSCHAQRDARLAQSFAACAILFPATSFMEIIFDTSEWVSPVGTKL